ncbi:hypothetical protein M3Y94_01281900 [Aphelenchoides besseyi]|nr:hypothetical protein M3Y94_01281900 [Aphelenchoides besseyi]
MLFRRFFKLSLQRKFFGSIMNTLDCALEELNLDIVLMNGQSFRWKKINGDSDRSDESLENESLPSTSNESPIKWPSEFFQGTAYGRVWRIWRVDPTQLGFVVVARDLRSIHKSEDDKSILRHYLQLDVNLQKLYTTWSDADPHFRSVIEADRQNLSGLRMLQQDPIETVFAFICSANNNFIRISKMVEKLCELYGRKHQASVDVNVDHLRTFPTLDEMLERVENMEQTLRAEGFGYRAAYIANSVRKLHELGGVEWLEGLKKLPYAQAHQALVNALPGVGPKVADCICLMALGKNEIVPVDTHVFAITAAHYIPELRKRKAPNKQDMIDIGNFYVERFGPHAGWAHSVLFTTRIRHLNKTIKSVEVKRKRKS